MPNLPLTGSTSRLTLPEVRQKIDETIQNLVQLRSLENQLLIRTVSADVLENPFIFCDAARRIDWFGNSMTLTKKQYLLLKTLWNAPEKRILISNLERRVWKHRSKYFVPTATMTTLVKRTNAAMERHGFGYKIFAVKNQKRDIMGFQLKKI